MRELAKLDAPAALRMAKLAVACTPGEDAFLVLPFEMARLTLDRGEILAACRAALITFQGSDDKAVPPQQSRAIVEAARQAGCPVAYLEFAGEGHGFRKLENKLEYFRRVEAFLEKNMNVPEGRVNVGPAVVVPSAKKTE